jgi:hypothetical protein
MDLAMQRVFTPMNLRLVERRKKALAGWRNTALTSADQRRGACAGIGCGAG